MLIDPDVEKEQVASRIALTKGSKWFVATAKPQSSALVIEKIEAEGWVFVQASTLFDRERLFFRAAG